MDQIAIALTGVAAIWLSQDSRENLRKWSCIFGLLGQPFWFYSAWAAEQWGIFALCFAYTFAWARGVYNHWLRPKLEYNTRLLKPLFAFLAWCKWFFLTTRHCNHDEGTWYYVNAGLTKVRHCNQCGKCLEII